jgi:hypothetical protein
MTHTSDLDHDLFAALHEAEVVLFTATGEGAARTHTADAWFGPTHFEATAVTATAALAMAMTGLRAAIALGVTQ